MPEGEGESRPMTPVQELIASVLGLGCPILILWLFTTSIISSNKYSFPDDFECPKTENYVDLSRPISIKEDIFSMWNSRISIENVKEEAKIIEKCPSFSRDSQIIIDNKYIGSTSTDSIVWHSFFMKDCHDNAYAYVENSLNKSNPAIKDYYIVRQIWSADKVNLYGYIVKKRVFEVGFSIIDENQKVLAKAIKNAFSLTWTIEILDPKHPAANINLILGHIGKLKFRSGEGKKKNTSDMCNEVYLWGVIFYWLFVVFLVVWVCKIALQIVKPDLFDEAADTAPLTTSNTSNTQAKHLINEKESNVTPSS